MHTSEIFINYQSIHQLIKHSHIVPYSNRKTTLFIVL